MIDPLQDSELDCLNSWPEGTIGSANDKDLIALVNQLCKEHGYGRIGQLAQAIEEIWRNPEEGKKKWQAFYDQRMELFRQDRENKEDGK